MVQHHFGKKWIRNFKNFVLWCEASNFKRVTIISVGLENCLGVQLEKCVIVPLEADQHSENSFKDLVSNSICWNVYLQKVAFFVHGFQRFIINQSISLPPKIRLVGTGMDIELQLAFLSVFIALFILRMALTYWSKYIGRFIQGESHFIRYILAPYYCLAWLYRCDVLCLFICFFCSNYHMITQNV